MKQWWDMKEKHFDVVLFFKVIYFYDHYDLFDNVYLVEFVFINFLNFVLSLFTYFLKQINNLHIW